MTVPISYTLIFLFAVLLFLSYAAIDPHSYYPSPIELGPNMGTGFLPGMFIIACIRVGNITFRAYELSRLRHAPEDSSGEPGTAGTLRTLDLDRDPSACSGSLSTNLVDSIAMIKEGECSIYTQITNCQERGANAVIFSEKVLANRKETLRCDIPYEVKESIGIPALFIPQSDYEQLLNCSNEDAVIWTISPEIDPTLLRILLLLVVRPLIMLTIVMLMIFVNFQRKKHKKRSSREFVRSLPRRQWDPESDGTWHQRQCSICLDDFEESCDIMTLPCEHEFHVQCISQWLIRRRGVCPLCFQDVEDETTPLLPNNHSC